jgi:predicted Fe-Mo cluster-binding NifX family protein
MKLCIPTMDDKGLDAIISEHFGKAPMYTIVDSETMEVEVFVNESDHNGGVGSTPEHIARYGAQVVLASGAGAGAISKLKGYGMKVYVGNKGTVREIVQKWASGTLTEADDKVGCSHHGSHHHHH